MILKPNNRGLTLIEVLIALSIFALSFLVLIDSQNMTIRNSSYSRRITTASILAESKLNELILKYKTTPISEIPEKESGEFEGKFSKFRWEETSRDFNYDLSFLIDMVQGEEEAEQEETDESPNPLLSYLPKISKFIQQSTKEVTVTIYWKEGKREKKLSVTTHLFDFKKTIAI